jgi:outer membrane autotransporter protein
MPSFGGYFAYRENYDKTGIQAKSSVAVSSGEAELSRSNLLGSAELVSGKADLDGYALAQTVGYGFGISNHTVVTPFAGIAYISAKRDGYTEEGDTAGLGDIPDDDVFTFDDYTQRTTLGSLGVALDYDSHERFSLRGGVGVNYILNDDSDELNATSSVAGLESVSTRLDDSTGDMSVTGYAGIGFDITDNQRISLDYAAWHSIDTDEYAQNAMLGWSYFFGTVTQELGK